MEDPTVALLTGTGPASERQRRPGQLYDSGQSLQGHGRCHGPDLQSGPDQDCGGHQPCRQGRISQDRAKVQSASDGSQRCQHYYHRLGEFRVSVNQKRS